MLSLGVARVAGLALAALVASSAMACSDAPPGESADEASSDLTGTTSAERAIHFESQVFVADGASDDAIRIAIARQVKTAIGALRDPKVALNDRAAQSNLDPSKWTKRSLSFKDPAQPTQPASPITRVTFKYDDRAVVTNGLSSRTAVDFVMLADDYGQHAAPLKTDCTDDPTTDTDSLWYHYQPQSAACRARIQTELDAIGAERRANGGGDATVGPAEARRWFVPVTAKLDPQKLPSKEYSPEYDRLYGLGDSRDKVVVYAFFGVDTDENNPDDYLGQEATRFLREMLRSQASFRPVKTSPEAMLLDFWVDGQKLSGVTYEKMFTWVLDKSGYPAEVGSDAAKIAELRRQAIQKLTERWIYWDLPITVKTAAGAQKDLTVEVRYFYGYEDGTADARQHAQWRYLEAFWHGDVFLYNGHSHFGHGPLEPTLYGPQNFNDRYQIMLVNSCISFNYYHQDFLAMKPGGSQNLDMVVNGLPSYVWGGGAAAARLLSGLFDGTQKSYRELLTGMRLDTPWGERAYDPMRVVDGELDNVYSKAATPLFVTTRPPVY